MSSDPPDEDQPQNDPSKFNKNREEDSLAWRSILSLCQIPKERSVSYLSAAGFNYTDNALTIL